MIGLGTIPRFEPTFESNLSVICTVRYRCPSIPRVALVMINPTAKDVHHGWTVELFGDESGFRIACYSPSRQRLSNYKTYSDQSQAMAAAKQLIDRQMAGHVLQAVMRNLFEQGALGFEDWRSLHNSLALNVRAFQ